MPRHTEFCSSCGQEMFPGARFCTYCGAPGPAPWNAEPGADEDVRRVLEVKKIGIWSVVKLAFMTNAVIGLLLGFLLAAVGMSGIGRMDLPFPIEGWGIMGTAPWVAVILVPPILYGLMGAVFGLILAVLYNIMAWGVGGIRITVRKR